MIWVVHANEVRRMGQSMHASTEQMAAAADHLLSVAAEIDSRHRVARDDVETLVGSRWRGIAPATHQELWQDWDGGYAEVVGALRDMAHKIATAAGQFNSTDDQNAASLNQAGSGSLNLDLS
jgi:WXG100 family type VII secretion target